MRNTDKIIELFMNLYGDMFYKAEKKVLGDADATKLKSSFYNLVNAARQEHLEDCEKDFDKAMKTVRK